MNILLLGADGQLGGQLRRALAPVGAVTALGRRGDARWCGDLGNPEGLAQTVRGLRPDVIVNAAAYTAVDRAEEEPDVAYAINATACEILAREARAIGAWLIHYSTDYVFDGSGTRPWRETDPTAPLNVYGRSKLAGERAIEAVGGPHLILRTSWVFETHGSNFIKSILRATRERESLEVVDDQWGTPTRAALIADVTAQLLGRLRPEHAGRYHLAAAGETSRHGLAVYAIECALERGWALKTTPQDVRPVPTAQVRSPAARPLNSRLDCTRLRETFGIDLPPWQQGVQAVVAELSR